MKITTASVCSSVCQTDGAEGEPVYGVQVQFDSGETVYCPDLNANRAIAERLCALLPGNDVDVAALWEVFSDFASITE